MTLRLRIAEDALEIAETLVFGARMTWPNCHVTVAQTGAEAVQQFTTESVDLVILDVNMPVLDGFDVCQCIRSTSSVPILMSTVRSEVLDKVRALDLWADDYVTNPCDILKCSPGFERCCADPTAPGCIVEPIEGRQAWLKRRITAHAGGPAAR